LLNNKNYKNGKNIISLSNKKLCQYFNASFKLN